MRRIYLDHASTTPILPEAADAMREACRSWANPSSPHAEGRAARARLEDARRRIAAALGWDGTLVFTSGATEALSLAFERARAKGFIVSAVEHPAVLRSAPGARQVAVHRDGTLDLDDLRLALEGAERPLVAVQSVNNETGVIHPIAEVAALVRAAGGLLLVDCAQSAGKFPVPAEADMAIVSAHKFGGPVGVGALLVKDFAMLHPTGGQERGYRRGTENLPGVLGMAAALEACADPYIAPEVLEPLAPFAEEVRALGGVWLADRLAHPTPYIQALAMPHLSGSAQLMRFDMAGISLSQGSACSSGSLRTSQVLGAMGLGDDLAGRMIRVSFGWTTRREDVERFRDAWLAMAREAAERAA